MVAVDQKIKASTKELKSWSCNGVEPDGPDRGEVSDGLCKRSGLIRAGWACSWEESDRDAGEGPDRR
jgi:hypothetical protein